MKILRLLLLTTVIIPNIYAASPLDEVIAQTGEHTHIGLIVQDANTNETVYKINSGHKFRPASILKLIINAWALDELGPDHKFKVDAYKHGNGDVTLNFEAAPSWTKDQLRKFFETLPISVIAGDLIVQAPSTEEFSGQKNWFIGDIEQVEAVEPFFPLIEENYYKGKILNNGKISVAGEIDYELINNIEVVKENEQSFRKYFFDKKGNIVVNGQIASGSSPMKLELPAIDMRAYLAQMIEELLQETGIELGREIVFSPTGSIVDARWLGSAKSEPLKDMIIQPTQDSSNIFFTSMLYILASKSGKEINSWNDIIYEYKKFLKNKFNIDNTDELELTDGFGLSFLNRVTPKQYHQVLLAMAKSQKIWKNLTPGFTINGVSGSLKGVLAENKYQGKLRGKTGRLQGASNFTGLVEGKSGKTFYVTLFTDSTPLERNAILKALIDTL